LEKEGEEEAAAAGSWLVEEDVGRPGLRTCLRTECPSTDTIVHDGVSAMDY